MMDPKVRSVMDEYQQRLDTENLETSKFDSDMYLRRRDAFLLGIGPETGTFLNILIKLGRPKVIVEVGTSYGYSTLWLAEAAACVGAKLITTDIDAEKSSYAAAMLCKAGLESCVEFITGDALTVLSDLDGQIDFALIDLWKELYVPSFERIFPKLSHGGVVFADNMTSPAYQRESAANYIAHVRNTPGIESVTIPIGSGIEMSIFQR